MQHTSTFQQDITPPPGNNLSACLPWRWSDLGELLEKQLEMINAETDAYPDIDAEWPA